MAEGLSLREDVVACDLQGGKALLDLRTSKYIKLNETAALIWQWIGEHKTRDEMLAAMVETYDVDEAECRADIESLIGSMKEAGLIEESAA
ncbi:Coenzyme PQQ synthesis protein D (PqqD) [Croceibacterium atlanticum]|uniref:Coenzyme PQQ synthesis protein D (PqqD) n=2 Tax=Croceibacterium atlanticum TaxID=1267766 RepID=A0A0F7KU34_9SPHN|nr:Coenzyme PQQ synthesis protein D (PqqD) [Croceibacterium atlanticum]